MHTAIYTEYEEQCKGFSRVSLTLRDFHPWQFGLSDSNLSVGYDFTLTWSFDIVFIMSLYHTQFAVSPLSDINPEIFLGGNFTQIEEIERCCWDSHSGLLSTDLSVTTGRRII